MRALHDLFKFPRPVPEVLWSWKLVSSSLFTSFPIHLRAKLKANGSWNIVENPSHITLLRFLLLPYNYRSIKITTYILKHGLTFTFHQFNPSWCCKFEFKWSELFMTWARLQHIVKIASSTHVVFCWILPSAFHINPSAFASGVKGHVGAKQAANLFPLVLSNQWKS